MVSRDMGPYEFSSYVFICKNFFLKLRFVFIIKARTRLVETLAKSHRGEIAKSCAFVVTVEVMVRGKARAAQQSLRYMSTRRNVNRGTYYAGLPNATFSL